MFDPTLPLGDQAPVDYTESYNGTYDLNAICVQACGREILKLEKLDQPETLKVWSKDGRRSRMVKHHYTLATATLSRVARPDTDDFACIKYGYEYEYLTRREAAPLLREIENRDGSMFRCAQLFP